MNVYLLLNFILHLGLALLLPLSNDEAYYWEWGQWLQWSYFDHPPGVSWMTALGSSILPGKLGLRILAPVFHTVLLWINFKILEEVADSSPHHRSQLQKGVFLLLLSSPGLFFMGSLALPDMGLWLFLQLALWYSLRLHTEGRLGAREGLIWGALLGAAALFKYHAFPMGFSMGLSLLYLRLHAGKREPVFYITGLLSALVILSPVWIWNFQHEWASFRFQAAHGFAAGNFSLRWPLQAALACAVVIGPPLFFVGVKAFWPSRSWRNDPLTILSLPAVFCLLGLISMAAMRKAILPHWILPAFSLALPWLSLQLSLTRSVRWWRWQLAYGISVLVIVAIFFNPLIFQRVIIPSFQGDPGPLSEVSIWDALAPKLEQQLHLWEASIETPSDCEASLPLATYRWWGAAQLHFRLPSRSPVLSLQNLGAGFYTLRDQGRRRAECPLAILLSQDQWQKRQGLEEIDILQQKQLIIPQHEKQSWVVVLGRWTRSS